MNLAPSHGVITGVQLMFGAMTRAADRWRAIRFTDFERRQSWRE
jgi:hypothetical protein